MILQELHYLNKLPSIEDMKKRFPLRGEILTWGPIPGKYFYPADFVPAIYEDFPQKFPGYQWPKVLFLFKENRMVWLNELSALQEEGRTIFRDWIVPKEKRIGLRERWRIQVMRLQKVQVKITPSFLSTLTKEELIKLGKIYYQLMLDFWAPTFPAELGNYGSEQVLKDKLCAFITKEKEVMAVMEILTTPEELSFYQQEEIDLVRAKDLLQHQQRYFWLKNSYAGTQVLPTEFFAERKIALSPKMVKELQHHLQEVKLKKSAVQQRYALSEEVIKIAEAICKGISWQDERKKHIFIMQHYKQRFLEEVATRKNRVPEELLKYSFREVLDILQGKPVPSQEGSFGFSAEKFHITELSSAQTGEYWKHYCEKEVEETDSFTGKVASKGKKEKIQGKVRIVLDPMKANSFKRGEILVAPMTSPEYIFAMKKAAAVITDSGGLTSHAAIVSRELKIACLVGTKIATKVLKDGDMVEVDAVKGIIRKIK